MSKMLSIEEVSKRLGEAGMRISPTLLRTGIKEGKFPFGDYVPTSDDKGRCYIYTKAFDEWCLCKFGERLPPASIA